MSDLKTSIVLDLAGNLQRRSRQFAGSLQDMSRRGSRSMTALNRSVSALGRGIDSLGNRYTALITGAAGVGAVRMVADLQKRLSQLQVDSRASADEIEALKKKLIEVARDPQVRLNPDDLLSGVEEIVTKTGDLDFAIENLKILGVTMRGAAVAGDDAAAVMTNFYKGGVRDSKDLLAVTDALIQQAKEGSVAYRDIAKVGNRLFAPYLAAGKQGEQAFKDMGAVAQATIDAVGSPEEAVTATAALLAQLKDPNIQKLLGGAGIKVFDGKEMRALPLLIEEIAKAADGDITKIGSVFKNESAIRVFEGALMEGNLEKMKRISSIAADGSELISDAVTNARNLDGALNFLSTTWKSMAEKDLGKPIQIVADALNSLEPETVDRWGNVIKNIALLGGGVLVGKKLGLGRLFGRKKGAGMPGQLGGSAGGAFGDAVPVYVVNGPSSIWNPSPPGGKPRAPGKIDAGKIPLLSVGGMALIPAAGAAVVGAASREIGERLAYHEARTSSTSRLQELLSRTMVMGGGPDSFQARVIKEELDRRFEGGMVDVGGTLDIRIRNDGPPVVEKLKSNNRNFNYDVEVNVGRSTMGS